MAREFLFACRNLVLALTPLFLGQFGQTKVLRIPKIMLFPVISGFLPKSESKWGLSRANTTPRDKRGVTTSKNPTLVEYFTSARERELVGSYRGKGGGTSRVLHVGWGEGVNW